MELLFPRDERFIIVRFFLSGKQVIAPLFCIGFVTDRSRNPVVQVILRKPESQAIALGTYVLISFVVIM